MLTNFAKMMAFCSALVLGAVACGGSEQAADGQDDLSATTKTFVSFHVDARRCSSPACGGFFVRDLNKAAAAETYVSAIDYSGAGLDQSQLAALSSVSASELVLFGKLGALNKATKTRSFQVAAVYRGLPGISAAAGDLFYRASDKSSALACVLAPCMNQLAAQVNGTASTSFSSYSVAGASKGFVDQQWLVSQVRSGAALVAGQIVDGTKEAGGVDKVLAASQVFFKLPGGLATCAPAAAPACAAGELPTFERDGNRCLASTGCATAGVCPQMMPSCDAGYTMVEWRHGPNACFAAACDPSFLR